MRKTSMLFVHMIALMAFAAWAPYVEALPGFGPDVSECMVCHDAGTPPSVSNLLPMVPIRRIRLSRLVAPATLSPMVILRRRVYAPDAMMANRG